MPYADCLKSLDAIASPSLCHDTREWLEGRLSTSLLSARVRAFLPTVTGPVPDTLELDVEASSREHEVAHVCCCPNPDSDPLDLVLIWLEVDPKAGRVSFLTTS